MENKGLNVFNTAYVLADEKTATDVDFERVEGVIGHEVRVRRAPVVQDPTRACCAVPIRVVHTFLCSQPPSFCFRVQYFHNWTGNRVTCRDWFQLTLKEGLTVFRDQEFSGDMNSKAVNRIENVRALRARQFAEDAGPMSHPIRPESYVVRRHRLYRVDVRILCQALFSPHTHLARWPGDGQFLHSRK
jgi:aminopeptidase N